MSHPYRLVTPNQMRALEAAAMAAGTPEHELQERAGWAVADVASAPLASGAKRITVLVGAGNNGRDGVVAARYLAAAGRRLEVWLGPRPALSAAEISSLLEAGIDVRTWGSEAGRAGLRVALAETDVAIDGLYGIGLRGPMDPESAGVAEVLNEARRDRLALRVVAVDVPSGVNAEDGSVPGAAVRADVTVTFGAVKVGLLRFPAARLVGRLEPRTIGLPRQAVEDHPIRILDGRVAEPLVPSRPIDAHKYRFGRTLVIAGSDAYVGAAYLASAAAARSGCGLVGIASTETVKLVLATRLPEATYPAGSLDLEREPEAAADRLAELLTDYQALLVGPGLGRSEGTARFLRRLLTANGRAARATPAVIDADALALLARWDGCWNEIGPHHILTPHAGEMARLAGLGPDEVSERPWDVARTCAAEWRQVVVMKGPFTTIASPNGDAWVYPHANPALATAGTGDVLAGLCAGLVAQGGPPVDAACLAVYVHALAGSQVLAARRWRTLLASDLLPQIPRALGVVERL